MAYLRLISQVLVVLGLFNGPFGAEGRGFAGVREGDRRRLTELQSQPWLTAHYAQGHAGNVERSRFSVCAGRHLCSDWGGHHNRMAAVPIDTKVWEFMPPPEYLLANWIRYYNERQGWKALQAEQRQHSDLAVRREFLPAHEFGLPFGEHELLFGHRGSHAGAEQGAGLMSRLPGNTYHFTAPGGGKRRAKRSCVLRRINRFLRRFQMITNRGLLGELIRAAGGLQGRLEFYRIRPNPAGAEGVGVGFRAGTANWMEAPRGETSLGAEIPRGVGVTTGGGRVTTGGETVGTVIAGENGVPGEETTNWRGNPSYDSYRAYTENGIGSADTYNGE